VAVVRKSLGESLRGTVREQVVAHFHRHNRPVTKTKAGGWTTPTKKSETGG
jgi:hypothetical protein